MLGNEKVIEALSAPAVAVISDLDRQFRGSISKFDVSAFIRKSDVSAFRKAIEATLPEIDAISAFRKAIEASLPKSYESALQRVIEASMPKSNESAAQRVIEASLPEIDAISAAQKAIEASMPRIDPKTLTARYLADPSTVEYLSRVPKVDEVTNPTRPEPILEALSTVIDLLGEIKNELTALRNIAGPGSVSPL